jgi:DNA mismatch repair protein MutS2
MDNKDLTLLEFPRIRAMIADLCAFSLSREAALELLPSRDLAWIRARLEESGEARRLLEAESGVSAYGLEEISPGAEAAARGKTLDPAALSVVRQSVSVMRQLRQAFTRHRESVPRLAEIASGIVDFGPLEKSISLAISPEGELLPNASEKLRNIRNNQRSRRSELTDKLQSIIASDSQRYFIQEPIVTEREGRFVLAVKSETRGAIKGIVHDVSNTGATLFVEPWQTLDLGNAIKELQIEEAREIERILSELSAQVGQYAADISRGIEASAQIDLALAKARFARRWQAQEAEVYQPTAGETPSILLENARHPLLGDHAVPLSVEIGRDFSILVITGPNTGGKTVALKTIGLLCLMCQAGLPVPAGPLTRLPVLNGIYADIGDEQSILETLSTFGWHMSNISRILKSVDIHSLVLLDELGASTDPNEGSALARAVMLHLLEINLPAVVTTHYTEVKLLAHATAGMQNASFDFDPRSMAPTYNLTLGTPGGSNAIATAAHFGLPAGIIARSRSLLSESSRQMEGLLSDLQSEKQRLESLNQELDREKESLTSRNRQLSIELDRVKTEKRQVIQEARDAAVAQISLLEKEIKRASSALKKETSQLSLNEARAASRLAREMLTGDALRPVSLGEQPDDSGGELAVGQRIWLNDYEVAAVITAVNPDSRQVEALAGSVRFRLAPEAISRVTPEGKALPKPPRSFSRPDTRAALELDLRGRRADEVESALDSYLSDAALSNLREVRIIHGFGTGVVRSIVRETAAHHPLVSAYKGAPPAEGGDGATIITLK